MKIRRLVFHRGLWLFGLSLLLPVAVTMLAWSTSDSVLQRDTILYPGYTDQFRTFILTLFWIVWLFSVIRYVMAGQQGHIWQQLLVSFAIVISIVLTFSSGFCGFWPAIYISVGSLAYFYTEKRHRNFWDGLMLIIFGIAFYICVLSIAFPVPSNLYHQYSIQLDDHIYNLAHFSSGIHLSDPWFNDIYALYRCDNWGIVCQRIHTAKAADYRYSSSGYLQTDPAAHTVSLVLDDEVVYTYHAAE